MTTTTDSPTAPAADRAAPQAGPARVVLLWRGVQSSRTSLRRWLAADAPTDPYTRAIAIAAAAKDSKALDTATARRDIVVKNRNRYAANIARLVLATLTGGAWPATVVYAASASWSWWMWKSTKDGPQAERERSGFKAACAALVVSLVLGLVNGFALGSWPLIYGWPNALWSALAAAVAAAKYGAMIWNGTIADDLPDAGPEHVTDVQPNAGTTAAVALALAMAVWGEKPGRTMMARDNPDRGKIRAVGGDLTWDTRHVWKSIRLQLAGRTHADVAKVREQLAGNLCIPADWLIVDQGSNASQVVLHIAEADPWPAEASPCPWLHQQTGDVWSPDEIGTDLLGGTPADITAVTSSMLVGASSGAGKTAFVRMLALMIARDPRATMDIVDFKGDGALKAFAPVCGTYISGSEDEHVLAFLRLLQAIKKDLSRRVKILERLPTDVAEDVKVTRELAHRRDLDLRTRFLIADEIQEATEHPVHGPDVVRLLKSIAKLGRSAGIKVILATQKPDSSAVPTAIRSVLPTRVALRTEDYDTSDMILGSKRFRANDLPPVGGAAIVKVAGDGGATQSIARVRLHYVNGADAAAAVSRIVAARRAAGSLVDERPPAPPILLAMRDVLAGADGGRVWSIRMARAMAEQGLIPAADPGDEQKLREDMADAVRSLDVRTRRDRSDRNRTCYWLDGPGGVRAALAAYAPGVPQALAGVSDGRPGPVYAGCPDGRPDGRPTLRAVKSV